MGCFGCFERKRSGTSKPSSSALSPLSTSRSYDSGAPGRHAGTSSGSAATTTTTTTTLSSPRSLPSLYEERAHNLRAFEFKELRSATDGFSRQLKIGEGGFGCVYRGSIKAHNGNTNTAIAVKKLNHNSLQGHKQWLAEVQFLGVVEHPNLVKLIGYCAVDGERGCQRLLVYEFMPNKSLDDHLFNKVYPSLPWNVRLQIALGAAEGLTYLHEGVEVQVIYRDFKASNVLLDEEFKPKLSDFGLAREGPSPGNTHVSTAVMGTYGYAAPDYIETGHLTAKSDVWSFGVVLYEILTGRKSTERNRPRNEQKLLDWVKRYPVESRRFGQIMDPRLENQYSMRAAREIAKLANICLSKNARDRPKMSEAVESIKQAMQFQEMDGCTDAVEGNLAKATEVDRETKDEQEAGSTESLRRRMLHLTKLNESANVVGRRKFMLMNVADPL
ncbi:putative serine/threonine-protein kinase PBL19 [Iris pallida]|uniref:non-specific serine/threonine protein kinase n=1 Tax=Iris pallida TaxID=29817 RepID=A0AAX6H7L5_IRIPA|nr:putative serine/threonine-protein kinase PBL19 [Iris pallida]